MDTVTAKLPSDLVRQLDALVSRGAFGSRSDAVREMVRKYLEDSQPPRLSPALSARWKAHRNLLARLAKVPRYLDRYVAVYGDRVLDVGDDPDALLKRATAGDLQPVWISRVLPGGELPRVRLPLGRGRRP